MLFAQSVERYGIKLHMIVLSDLLAFSAVYSIAHAHTNMKTHIHTNKHTKVAVLREYKKGEEIHNV